MDFDVWAQKGNRGWSFDDVLLISVDMSRFENRVHGDYLRGQSGEMTITNSKMA